jgi:hypothetical protein
MRFTIVGCCAVFVVGFRMFSQQQEAEPFTAKIVKRFFRNHDDSKPKTLDITYARKGNRSLARSISSTAPDGTHGEFVGIIDSGKAQEIILEPFTKSKITLPYGSTRLANIVNRLESENCPADANPQLTAASSSAGGEPMFGEHVALVKRTMS